MIRQIEKKVDDSSDDRSERGLAEKRTNEKRLRDRGELEACEEEQEDERVGVDDRIAEFEDHTD